MVRPVDVRGSSRTWAAPTRRSMRGLGALDPARVPADQQWRALQQDLRMNGNRVRSPLAVGPESS